ncbi:MAG: nitrate reductase [Acidimicrobiia bacterium]|nr:nitrate reductase [Acidimicrobiia bacterium]
MMGAASVIAVCFDYPGPGHLEALRSAIADLGLGSVRDRLESFAGAVGSLPLGEWEELHTRTLDLSPSFVPYVGHVIWGESYRRGAFMADLSRDMTALQVDRRGELPDHLGPILRYLDVAREPLDDLVAVLPKAVTSMSAELKEADRTNPYRHVLAAVEAQLAVCLKEPVRSDNAG